MNQGCLAGQTYQSGAGGGGACPVAGLDSDQNAWVLTSYYDFDPLRLNLAYGQQYKKSHQTGVKTSDTTDFLIGFSSLGVGDGNLLMSLVRHTDKGTGTAAYWNAATPKKITTWMLGVNYDYPLSRRTKLQGGLMLMKSNSDYAVMPTSAGYQGGQVGNFRNSGFTIGMNHRF
jgi:predicted porin